MPAKLMGTKDVIDEIQCASVEIEVIADTDDQQAIRLEFQAGEKAVSLRLRPPFACGDLILDAWSPEEVLFDGNGRLWISNDGWQLLVFTIEGQPIYITRSGELYPASSMVPWSYLVCIDVQSRVWFKMDDKYYGYQLLD